MYKSVIKNIIPESFIWLILIVIIIIVFVIIFLLKESKKDDLSNYVKRKFLFDTKSEFDLFLVLLELFGDKYHIFPQVHYSHVIEVRKGLTYSERMHYWNKINRKSADFVLCDKIQVIPRLVIELDGSSHEWEERKKRDEFINELMGITGLNIKHLKTDNLSKEFIKQEIEKSLNESITPISTN